MWQFLPTDKPWGGIATRFYEISFHINVYWYDWSKYHQTPAKEGFEPESQFNNQNMTFNVTAIPGKNNSIEDIPYQKNTEEKE